MITEGTLFEIVCHLIGTTKTLSEACNAFGVEEDKISKEQLQDIDAEIFNCDTCNWWCDVGDMSTEDRICEDCKE